MFWLFCDGGTAWRVFHFYENVAQCQLYNQGHKKTFFVNTNSHNFIVSRERHSLKAWFWKDLEQISPVWWQGMHIGRTKVQTNSKWFCQADVSSKNQWTNSTLLLVDLFSFVFWKKVVSKKTFRNQLTSKKLDFLTFWAISIKNLKSG